MRESGDFPLIRSGGDVEKEKISKWTPTDKAPLPLKTATCLHWWISHPIKNLDEARDRF